MYKVFKVVIYALGILGVILFGGILFSNVDPWADFLFYVAYVLLAVAVVSVVIYGMVNIFSSPSKLKKTAIYTGAFLLIILASYIVASGNDETEKLVVAGIYSVYVLGAIATLLMVASGVKKVLIK